MRIPLMLLLVLAVLCAGCFHREDAKASVPGPIASLPAAPNVSTPTETLVADHANAVATHNKPAEVAAEVALVDQARVEQIGSLHWLLLACALLVSVGVFIGWQGRVKIGTGLILSGISLALSQMLLTAIIPYEGYLAVAGIVAGVVALIWHFRLQVGQLTASLETHALALEHAVAHSGWISHSEHAVANLLGNVWDKVSQETRRAAVALHLVKGGASAADIALAPLAPPAAAPAAPAAK